MSKENKKHLHKIIHPKGQHWVGDGFHVNTLFSVFSEDYHFLSPFLLLDHAAPKKFAPTEKKLGVGEHPHRGFETVTFAIQGEVDHRDSGGGGGRIETGGVQWMTAGSGVVHEEFHSRAFAERGGIFEMVQLWVNLRAKDKMTPPRYQSMNKEDFPLFLINSNQAEVRLIAGEYDKFHGPARTFSPIQIFEVFTQNDQDLSLNLPDQTNTLIIQLKGTSMIEKQNLQQGEVAVFSREGCDISTQTTQDSHLLVLNGEPIDEPVAQYGPFVMNNKSEIRQALKDFEDGKMGQLVQEVDANGGN